MTDPRISLPRVPGLREPRQLDRYLKFCYYFGSDSKFSNSHKHHIHPVKMGGSDSRENWIWLTPRAHYIAHKLLFLAFRSQAAQRACWYLSHRSDIRISSKEYENLKNNYFFSDETRRRLREAGTGRVFSEAERSNISESNKRTWMLRSESSKKLQIARMIRTKTGKAWSDKQREAIVPSLPRNEEHWRAKGNKLWERKEEIYQLWIENDRCGFKRLCKALGIPPTKTVLTIARSMI